jgi:Erv1 / Alr family
MSKSKTTPLPKKFPLTPEIWGPHYWFFLFTVAYAYPEYPTNVTKRKYYDLIQNMPLFIPDPVIGDRFEAMLIRYPITPFLDSRESMIRWVHFVHNKINASLGKEEISIYKALDAYYAQYLPRPLLDHKQRHQWRDMVYMACVLTIVLIMYRFSTAV